MLIIVLQHPVVTPCTWLVVVILPQEYTTGTYVIFPFHSTINSFGRDSATDPFAHLINLDDIYLQVAQTGNTRLDAITREQTQGQQQRRRGRWGRLQHVAHFQNKRVITSNHHSLCDRSAKRPASPHPHLRAEYVCA